MPHSATDTDINVPVTSFDEAALAALPPTSPFVGQLRKDAFAEFNALPIPSQETEEWRYTDLSALELSFAPFTRGGTAASLDEVPEEIVAGAAIVGDRSGLQIQRNSEVLLTNLDAKLAEQGVVFGDLATAILERPDLVEPYLHAIVPTGRSKFTALHAAFRTGGTFLYVPEGVTIEVPLQSLTWVDVDGAAVFPHTLIVAGPDAEVTFIDRYASPDLEGALSDAVTEIHADASARVRYVSIQDWGAGMTHLAVQRAHLSRDADLRTTSVGFGADLARVEAESVMAGIGASSEALGLFFADGDQHFDHRTEQDHVAAKCTSDLLYKGALRDTSRGVYSGWVHVRPGAQGTNAMQTSRNIMLSEGAFARAIPNLEIEANDVRCGHAASAGPVDDDQLFYLGTRGIARAEAEKLIVKGFFQEVIDRITIEEVRESVAAEIEDELQREDV
ncbi:MAG: Fe-S cluster assembly protein SufD [Actinomycetota bacterium]